MRKNISKLKRFALACAVAVGFACGTDSAFAQTSGGTIDPVTVFKQWTATTVKDLVSVAPNSKGKRFRVIGTVEIIEGDSASREDEFRIRGLAGGVFTVRCVNSRPMPNDHIFILGTVQADADGTLYFNEAYRYRYITPEEAARTGATSPTTQDLRDWHNFDEKYALDNSFRRFVVVRSDGQRLPIITKGDFADYGKTTKVTEVEDFMKGGGEVVDTDTTRERGREREWERESERDLGAIFQNPMALALIGVAVVLVLVLIIALVAKSGKSRPAPFPPQMQPMSAPTPTSLPTAVAAPAPAPMSKITTVLEGRPVDPRSTQVLSGYALKILAGGKFAGETLYLSEDTMIGRDVMDYKGYFLQLDMSDRPDKESYCSRNYVRLTHRSDEHGVFDVEVVNDKNNPVTVDGKTIKGKGETAVAKVGSKIKLMPDWEFELFKA